jgi:hypothetical protein
MNRKKFQFFTFVGLAILISNCIGAIDVEHYTIGDARPECFRFAIFADPQVGTGGGDIAKLVEAVNKVIDMNNDGDPNNDIRFVVVLGDFIQGGDSKGEAEYRQEYEQVKAELERLETARPVGAGIQYVPVIGNHDIWFDFIDYTPVDDPPDYPEELFADYFGSQYEELSAFLTNWSKQEAMPSTNPYSLAFPAPCFQNFAFDYGPYHFICLDFSARDDFDPIAPGFFPRLKKFSGYADLHDVNNGTWKWLTDHLDECRQSGIKDIIVFTHHPPLYELEIHTGNPGKIRTTPYPFAPLASPAEIKGEMRIISDPFNNIPPGTTLSNYRTGPGFLSWDGEILVDYMEVDRVEGDVLLTFNKQNYDGQDEYDRLASLSSDYGINIVHWFSGHYHVKGFEWKDNNIDADVTAVPSVIPASMISGIEFDGSVKINEQADAVVTPQDNPNGCIAVVRISTCYADIDGDSNVTFKDFGYLASQWLSSPNEPSADIAPLPDGDGIVNEQDLAAFVERWLKRCE